MEISPSTASVPRLMIGFQSGRPEEHGHGITIGSGACEMVGDVILAKVWRWVELVTADLRGVAGHAAARPDGGGWCELRIMVPSPALT